MNSRHIFSIQSSIIIIFLIGIPVLIAFNNIDFKWASLLWGALFGALLQLYQSYIVQADNVTIEIISIQIKDYVNDIPIDITKYEDIINVIDYDFEKPLFSDPDNEKRKARVKYTLNEISSIIIEASDEITFQKRRAKQISKLTKDIDRNLKDLDRVNIDEYNSLQSQLSLIVIPDKNKDKSTYLNEAKAKLEEHQKAIEIRIATISNLVLKANAKINEISTEATEESRYILTVAFINSGRLGTAVKSKAILRVFRKNYEMLFDMELDMKNFASDSAISPTSTKVIYFESAKIKDLDKGIREDQNAYWNRDCDCVLVASSINSKRYLSKNIEFFDRASSRAEIKKLKEFVDNIKPMS